MADTQDTSVSQSISGLGDQVEAAVAGNAQESGQQQTQETQSNQEVGGTKQEVVADAKATLKDPKASKTQKKQAAQTLKKLTLKVDGEEFEEELPFEIPNTPEALEFMRRELQMGRMGQKRAQEKAAIEKEILRFYDEMKKNPKKALRDPVWKDIVDLKKLAADVMEEEIENAKKTPEQLALEKAQEEIREMKEQREKEKAEQESRENEALRQRYVEQYDNEITSALESNRIPKSPQAVKKLADYMEIAIAANKDVSFNDLIPILKDELISDYQQHLDALPDDELESYIGKKTIDRIRKRNLAKAKQASSNPAVKGATKVSNTGKTGEEKPAEKKISMKDFFKLGPT